MIPVRPAFPLSDVSRVLRRLLFVILLVGGTGLISSACATDKLVAPQVRLDDCDGGPVQLSPTSLAYFDQSQGKVVVPSTPLLDEECECDEGPQFNRIRAPGTASYDYEEECYPCPTFGGVGFDVSMCWDLWGSAGSSYQQYISVTISRIKSSPASCAEVRNKAEELYGAQQVGMFSNFGQQYPFTNGVVTGWGYQGGNGILMNLDYMAAQKYVDDVDARREMVRVLLHEVNHNLGHNQSGGTWSSGSWTTDEAMVSECFQNTPE